MKKSLILCGFAALWCGACSTTPNGANDPILKEAFKYHTEALSAQATFEGRLEKLKAQAAELEASASERHLTEDEMALIDKADRLDKSYATWKDHLVEVPGFEHTHDCSKHGHHHHAPVELTPQQMLDVQKATLAAIQDLSGSAKELVE